MAHTPKLQSTRARALQWQELDGDHDMTVIRNLKQGVQASSQSSVCQLTQSTVQHPTREWHRPWWVNEVKVTPYLQGHRLFSGYSRFCQVDNPNHHVPCPIFRLALNLEQKIETTSPSIANSIPGCSYLPAHFCITLSLVGGRVGWVATAPERTDLTEDFR